MNNDTAELKWAYTTTTTTANFLYCKLCYPSDSLSKNQRKWKERQVLKLCLRTKKAVEPVHDGDTNCDWYAWNGSKGLERRLEELEIGGWIDTIQTTALLR